MDEAENDPELRAEAVLVRQARLFHSRAEDIITYSERELPAAIAQFERAGDDRLLAKALCARARVARMTGVFGPSVENGCAAEVESAPDDAINFAITHCVLARIAADRGNFEAAAQLAHSAVEWAYRMDQPAVHASALWGRVHVLLASGQRGEAAAILDEAIGIYERKGEYAGAAHLRRVFAGAFAHE